MKMKLILGVVLSLMLLVFASPVYAIPALPHAFYGNVEVNGSLAPDGTQVSAAVEAGDIVSVQNPVGTVGGKYGVDSQHLLVQGNGLSGAITFYVGGHEAVPSQTVTFEVGGGPTRVDLSVTIAAPPPAPPVGNGVEPPTYHVEANLFGTEESLRISRTGEVLKTIEVTSEDGMLTLTIPKGTTALGKDSKRLKRIEAAVDENPPGPPENAHIIGLAYDFGPIRATFSPPITFTWTYNLKDLPKGVDPEDLTLAYYDRDAQEWVELDCEVDTRNKTITASVAHFTVFAIIGRVVELPPEPVVEPIPAPEPEPEVVEPEPAPTPKAPPAEPAPPAPPAKPPFNWLWVIIGAVVVVGLLVFFLVRRRGY